MKLRHAPFAFAVLASLAGCASPTDEMSTASTKLETNPIAACEYDKPCVDAVVLRAVFNSEAMVTEGEKGDAPLPRYVASWLGVAPDRGTVEITTKPNADGSSTSVHLLLTVSAPDGEMASGCWLDFTIVGTAVREMRLIPTCAG